MDSIRNRLTRLAGAKRLILARNTENPDSRRLCAGLSAISGKNRAIVINMSVWLSAISDLSGVSRHQTTAIIRVSVAMQWYRRQMSLAGA